MLVTVVSVVVIAAVLIALVSAAVVLRRRQQALFDRREAAQLLRRADHLFKIALASQVHTRRNAVAQVLLQEASRIAQRSLQLDPQASEPTATLRECEELLAEIGDDDNEVAESDTSADFPETELIEAQLHLTEAIRLLNSLEKHGQITFEQLQAMVADLKQAQRALDLRLQLRRAGDAIQAVDAARTPEPDHGRTNSFQ